ncbi:hypothetical protein MPRF_09780 [Mycolicibacterium parafortuitum]|uniref:Uncharacterized protein n=1 Tax=Mycolicibacterium parafortuitum TaxID=39692 RepID=A0A7I7U071_MYCPF|nr:hypothetical protein MPRF_09780 [Mycolicibacterium parafortuitum]
MTAWASATEASATCPVTTPVAGLVTGADAPLVPANTSLFTQCEIVLAMEMAPFRRGLRRAWWDISDSEVSARPPGMTKCIDLAGRVYTL